MAPSPRQYLRTARLDRARTTATDRLRKAKRHHLIEGVSCRRNFQSSADRHEVDEERPAEEDGEEGSEPRCDPGCSQVRPETPPTARLKPDAPPSSRPTGWGGCGAGATAGTHSCQPCGGGGHEGSGVHPGGAGGHVGGGLNCHPDTGSVEGAVCGGAAAGTGEGEATVWAACSMILKRGDASSPWTSPKSVSAPSSSSTTRNSRCL